MDSPDMNSNKLRLMKVSRILPRKHEINNQNLNIKKY